MISLVSTNDVIGCYPFPVEVFHRLQVGTLAPEPIVCDAQGRRRDDQRHDENDVSGNHFRSFETSLNCKTLRLLSPTFKREKRCLIDVYQRRF